MQSSVRRLEGLIGDVNITNIHTDIQCLFEEFRGTIGIQLNTNTVTPARLQTSINR